MKIVAKAVLIDEDNKYLLMKRSDHPRFGRDADLPGGTLESGEAPLETMIREVTEEIGVALDSQRVEERYAGTDYSIHKTMYHLYTAQVGRRPDIVMSWEHSAYDWVEYEEFLEQSHAAVDTYMHMVHDVMKSVAK